MKLFGWREEIRKRKEIKEFNRVILRVLWEGADRCEDVLGKLAFNDIYRFRDTCESMSGQHNIVLGTIKDNLSKLAFNDIYKRIDTCESRLGQQDIVSGPIGKEGKPPKKKDK